MIAIIFKAFLFYFLFLFIRSVWRGYKMVEEIKSRAADQSENGAEKSQSHSRGAHQRGDVLEAEYRVLDKEGD
jgi:hypothetical protein